MSRNLKKIITIISMCTLMIMLFCSCGNEEATPTNSPAKEFLITIEVDGKTITVEDTEGKTIKEILKDAKINLTNNDIVSVDADKNLSDGITIKILKKFTVNIKNTIDNTERTIVVVGSTVKDALDAAGVKLAENHTTNLKLTDALKDGMEIEISIKEEPTTTQAYVPDDDADDSYDNSSNNSGNNSNSNNRPNSNSGSSATKAPTTTKAPAPTKAPSTTKAPTTKPATTSGRTVVSVDVYEDCDGSGHGVKVITYSDGTQEEVAF